MWGKNVNDERFEAQLLCVFPASAPLIVVEKELHHIRIAQDRHLICLWFSYLPAFSLPAHVDLQLYAVMDNKVCIMVVDTHEKLRGLPILAFRWVVQVWC